MKKKETINTSKKNFETFSKIYAGLLVLSLILLAVSYVQLKQLEKGILEKTQKLYTIENQYKRVKDYIVYFNNIVVPIDTTELVLKKINILNKHRLPISNLSVKEGSSITTNYMLTKNKFDILLKDLKESNLKYSLTNKKVSEVVDEKTRKLVIWYSGLIKI